MSLNEIELKKLYIFFFESLIKDLDSWAKDAEKFLEKNKLVADVETIFTKTANRLRTIDHSIEVMLSHIQFYYKLYKDLEDEYELKPLSLNHGLGLSQLTEDLNDVLYAIVGVASEYDECIKQAEKEKLKLERYIRPKHMKAIELLKNMTLQDLLKWIERGYLRGL